MGGFAVELIAVRRRRRIGVEDFIDRRGEACAGSLLLVVSLNQDLSGMISKMPEFADGLANAFHTRLAVGNLLVAASILGLSALQAVLHRDEAAQPANNKLGDRVAAI